MSGFPLRPNRDAFGPEFENVKPVVNPKHELDANTLKLVAWQVAGLSQVSPRVVISGSVSGGVVTTEYQALAFDPHLAISNIIFTYVAAGRYSFAFDSEYEDQNGVDQTLDLIGGVAAAINTDSLFFGIVNMATAYSGEVRIFNSSGTLADPPEFLMQLW